MLIYKIENKLNGKIYIGKTTKSLKTRLRKHLNLALTGKGFALHTAIRKYGSENFHISLMEECNTEDQYHKIECLYIKDLNTMTPNGYNCSVGGKGEVRSIESYRVQSLKMAGREISWGDKISRSLIAKNSISPMNGEKYKDTSMFKGNTQAGNRNVLLKGTKIRCIEDDCVFSSIREAGLYYSLAGSSIQRSMNKTGFVKKINKTFEKVTN